MAKKQPPGQDTVGPLNIPADTIRYEPSDNLTFNPNLENLVRYQEEQRRKQKRAAMIRIGIGVAFLGVLIAGLLRRQKK